MPRPHIALHLTHPIPQSTIDRILDIFDNQKEYPATHPPDGYIRLVEPRDTMLNKTPLEIFQAHIQNQTDYADYSPLPFVILDEQTTRDDTVVIVGSDPQAAEDDDEDDDDDEAEQGEQMGEKTKKRKADADGLLKIRFEPGKVVTTCVNLAVGKGYGIVSSTCSFRSPSLWLTINWYVFG